MYDEAEYIYHQFQTHFAQKKNQPLILYGIGNNTGKLLKSFNYLLHGLLALLPNNLFQTNTWPGYVDALLRTALCLETVFRIAFLQKIEQI